MNDKAKHFVATAEKYQTNPPTLFTLAEELSLQDKRFPCRCATEHQKRLMEKLLWLKMDESDSTEEERLMIDESAKKVVQEMRATDKSERKDGLFNALAELKPVVWGFDDNSRKFKWKVDHEVMPLWMLAFVGIVRDWGVNFKEVKILACGEVVFQDATLKQIENRQISIDEAYTTWARMKLTGLDLLDIAP
ncbi:hypothetical protein HBI56_117570 [Parastagonospora nodorum]|nr:hypothetical protein HBH50_125140 [Parastagonospora nodorum]KAH4085466.1 hypothetical protein HBH48_150010 [Parastagonospora nodorum]KAH4962777.1 hypothetical protein HBI78_121900 [Parastagonospora nodorum]KAH5054598.1 hypothetical protein HBH96_135260 [Parastagonospora nodorum]KAH5205444.1 hypothetical protein HBH77_099130 [Parastagonospora nodorum]